MRMHRGIVSRDLVAPRRAVPRRFLSQMGIRSGLTGRCAPTWTTPRVLSGANAAGVKRVVGTTTARSGSATVATPRSSRCRRAPAFRPRGAALGDENGAELRPGDDLGTVSEGSSPTCSVDGDPLGRGAAPGPSPGSCHRQGRGSSRRLAARLRLGPEPPNPGLGTYAGSARDVDHDPDQRDRVVRP